MSFTTHHQSHKSIFKIHCNCTMVLAGSRLDLRGHLKRIPRLISHQNLLNRLQLKKIKTVRLTKKILKQNLKNQKVKLLVVSMDIYPQAKISIITQFYLDILQTGSWELLLLCPDVPECIRLSGLYQIQVFIYEQQHNKNKPQTKNHVLKLNLFLR